MRTRITEEEKIAMAEAYRVYEVLDYDDKLRIPQEFIDLLKEYGALDKVKPFSSGDEALNANLSEKGNYLLMYMCTFA